MQTSTPVRSPAGRYRGSPPTHWPAEHRPGFRDNYAGNLARPSTVRQVPAEQRHRRDHERHGVRSVHQPEHDRHGAEHRPSVGTRILEANSVGTTGTTLTADGNSEFDRLVFTAPPCRRSAVPPVSPTNDSSDYLVTNLRYQVNGSNVTATPNGGEAQRVHRRRRQRQRHHLDRKLGYQLGRQGASAA